MNDNRNMLLAIVLSALVLIGWSLLSDKFFPTAGPQTQQIEKGKVQPVPQPERDTLEHGSREVPPVVADREPDECPSGKGVRMRASLAAEVGQEP